MATNRTSRVIGYNLGGGFLPNADETEYSATPAERRIAIYTCPNDGDFYAEYAEEAWIAHAIPQTTECPNCFTSSPLDPEFEQDSVEAEQDKKLRDLKTHWDMVRERRTMEELEANFQEHLQALRARRGES